MTRGAVLRAGLTAACLAMAGLWGVPPAAALAQDQPAPETPRQGTRPAEPVKAGPDHGAPQAPPAAAPTGNAPFDEALARARKTAPDETPFDDGPAWRDFVAQVWRTQAVPGSPNLLYKSVVNYPAANAGNNVRVLGLVAQLKAVRLPEPVEGRENIWRGFIANTSGDDPVVFDLLERPADFVIGKDLMELEGVVFRTVSYETKQNSFVTVPYVVARSIRIYQSHAAASSNEGGTHWLLAAAGLAAGIALVVVLRFRKPVRAQSTTAAGFRQMMADAQHRKSVQQRTPGAQDPEKESKEGPDAQV